MERIGKRHDNHNTSSGDRGGVPSIQCRLRAARNELFRRLSKGVKGNDIILSKLSTDGKWVALFDGPTKQLDITWITSMNSKPLLSEVYRVQSTGPGSALLRDVAWLSDPEAPQVIEVAPREVVLGWPEIDGRQAGLLRREMAQGGAAFQVEVCEGPVWQPARVQQRRILLAAKAAEDLTRGGGRSTSADDDPVPMDGQGAFMALEAVDGVGGARIVGLLPATWYHMRLRVTYDGCSAAVGPPVAVATKCGPPDTPIPRPQVVEELVDPGSNSTDVLSLVSPPAAARTLGCLIHDISPTTMASSSVGHRLRVSWVRPRTNGYPIQYYILQQRELVLPPVSSAKNRRRVDERTIRTLLHPYSMNDPQVTGEPLGQRAKSSTSKWTSWREVHANLLPESLVRAPTRCPASITAARHVLGLSSSSNISAAFSSADMLHRGTEPPPRFIAIEFRVAAVNALGASKFSQVTRVTELECPTSFLPSVRSNEGPSHDSQSSDRHKSRRVYSSVLEAELEELASALEFPVSLGLVKDALDATRGNCSSLLKRTHPPVCRKEQPKQRTLPSKTNLGLYSPAQRMVMDDIIGRPK